MHRRRLGVRATAAGRASSTRWPRARALRFEENIGFCAGCNRGAEAATGRLLAFVNFDGEVEPGWDAPLIELLRRPGGLDRDRAAARVRTAR